MERPAKRIRLSDNAINGQSTSDSSLPPTLTSAALPAQQNPFAVSLPTRVADLFDRPRASHSQQNLPRVRRRNGIVLRPRAPEVTVTTDAVVVAVNGGSVTSEIVAPTSDTAIVIPSMGTLTVPALTSVASDVASGLNSALPGLSLGSGLLSSAVNSTILSNLVTSTDLTVTVTSTSTYSVSYRNGTFIQPTATDTSHTTHTPDSSDLDGSAAATSSDGGYTFGEGFGSSPSTTSINPAYQTGGIAGAGASLTSSGAAATSSSASDGNSAGPGLTTKQAQAVGGVVGGVAGVAFVLVIVLYVLRWYRQRLKAQGRLPEQLASGPHHNEKAGALVRSVASLSHSSRSSLFPGFPGQKVRPQSDGIDLTRTTAVTAPDSEKGFQRISGRKIPSVLTNGGDPYGGNYGAFEHPRSQSSYHDLNESTFYRDAAGIYIGRHNNASTLSEPTTPTMATLLNPKSGFVNSQPSLSSFPGPVPPTTALQDFAAQNSPTSRDGFAMMRSSPARTPISQSPNTSSIRLPIQASVTMDEDIPEMPLSPRTMAAIGGLVPQHQLMPSRSSQRSGSTGRFKEDIS